MSRSLAFRSHPGGRRSRRAGFALAAGALLAASALPAADLVVQGSNSPYPFTTGTAAYTNIYVGQTADGTLNQSGGTLTSTNFYLGYNAGVTGTCNLSAGTLNTAGAVVGESGTGVFNQTGGVFNDSGGVYLGYNGGSTGTLTLSGGTLTETNFFEVGYNGTGTLNVSAGTLDASADPYAFTVGFQAGSQGTVSLSGTGVLKPGRLIVGNGGNGVVTQSGSSVVTLSGLLAVGNDDSSGSAGLGTYNLQGGTLSTQTTYVGDSNNSAASVFNQTGGTHTVNGALQFGYQNTISAGTYNLSGGTLTVNQVVQNAGTGTFNFNGGTLRAGAAGTTFMQGLSAANVQAGGAFIDTQGNSITVAQPLAHDPTTNAPATDGGLTKLGTGTLTLTGTNTYTGNTTVSAGTLLANNTTGSATGTGALTVGSGGTLGGTGAVAGAVTVQSGGRLDAGNAGAAGMLSLGSSLSLPAGATLGVQLGGTAPGTGYDQIRVAGTLTLGGTLSVTELSGFQLTLGQTFVLLDDTGLSLVTTAFANVAAGGLYTDAAGNTFQVNYAAIADGDLVPNDVTLTVQSVVPEPSTWALLAVGTAALALVTLRRRRHTTAARA